jgi:hypothetical protein
MLVLYTKHYQDDVIGNEIGVNVNQMGRNEKCVHIATFKKKLMKQSAWKA